MNNKDYREDDAKSKDNNIIVLLQVPNDRKGLCIDRTDLNLMKGPYTIPGLTDEKNKPLFTNKTVYNILKTSIYKVFMVFRLSSFEFFVSPIIGKKLEDFLVGELVIDDFLLRYSEYLIGSGVYGDVFANLSMHTVTKTSKDNNRISQDVIREIAFYSMLRHSGCLPELYSWDIRKSKMVLEANTDVGLYVFTPSKLPKFYLQMVECLRITANQGVIHGDLKPSNMVITRTPAGERLYVIDWGLAQLDRSKNQNHPHNPTISTATYKAPEVWFYEDRTYYKDERITYGSSIDIFSMGVIMIDIITQKTLLCGNKSPFQIASKKFGWYRSYVNATGKRPKVPLDIYIADIDYVEGCKKSMNKIIPQSVKRRDHFIDLVSRMVVPNPSNRATYEQILAHPYFDRLKRQSHPIPTYVNKVLHHTEWKNRTKAMRYVAAMNLQNNINFQIWAMMDAYKRVVESNLPYTLLATACVIVAMICLDDDYTVDIEKYSVCLHRDHPAALLCNNDHLVRFQDRHPASFGNTWKHGTESIWDTVAHVMYALDGNVLFATAYNDYERTTFPINQKEVGKISDTYLNLIIDIKLD
jgi:serine/threonine protein kinase